MDCQYIITRGVRKDEACGKKRIDNSEFCRIHSKLQNVQGCDFILTRGDKKGEKCNRKVKENSDKCSIHTNDINFSKCEVEIIRGKRAGEKCGRRCPEGITVCTVHGREKEPPKTCQKILLSGKRKGEICGKKTKGEFCTGHEQKEERTCMRIIDGRVCGSICKNRFCSKHSKIKKETNVCAVIISRGNRKGEICGKSCKEKVCPKHKGKEVQEVQEAQEEHVYVLPKDIDGDIELFSFEKKVQIIHEDKLYFSFEKTKINEDLKLYIHNDKYFIRTRNRKYTVMDIITTYEFLLEDKVLFNITSIKYNSILGRVSVEYKTLA